MTPQQQNIAIAEFCGWIVGTPNVDGSPANWGKLPPGDWRILPDYVHDLNAMHEAELKLDSETPDKRSLYIDNLLLCSRLDYLRNGHLAARFESQWSLARASAPERAEALLRTIGKWGAAQ